MDQGKPTTFVRRNDKARHQIRLFFHKDEAKLVRVAVGCTCRPLHHSVHGDIHYEVLGYSDTDAHKTWVIFNNPANHKIEFTEEDMGGPVDTRPRIRTRGSK